MADSVEEIELEEVEVDETNAPEPVDAGTLVEWFEAAEEATENERKLSERDRDYYDDIQWTSEEIETLKKRGQPVITINKIKPRVNFLVGYEARTRTDPKAFPRTPNEDEGAESATDALRFVADKARFPQTKTAVWGDVLVEGYGGALIGVKKCRIGYEVTITRIPWDRLFRDPHSRERDFSDAMYKGVVTWMDYDEAVKKFPEGKEALARTLSDCDSKTYDDRPRWRKWADGKRKRARICEIYYRKDGIWWQAFFTEGGELKKQEPVAYLDDEGKPECPLELVSAYCNRENERYGVVRIDVPLQDEVNKRRSKALHLLTMRQVRMQQGAADIATVRKELAKPDGVIVTNPGMDFEILPTGEMAIGQFNLLEHATQELQVSGPNAALLGKQEGAPSGRAILANQQGGQVELEPLLDGLRDWQRRVMTQAWNRVRQYWTAETWVRVTDDEKNLKWVGLNVPVVQQTPFGPQQVGVENSLAELDVDILIEEAPDTANLQAEQFEQITQMVGAGVPIPPDVVVELSSLKNKDAILERMRGNPEQAAAMAQKQEAQKDAAFQADLEKTQSEAAKNRASAVKTIGDAAAAAVAAEMQANAPMPMPLEGVAPPMPA